MKVAVIGCGPAGLAAAHAATQIGCTVDIFAPKVMTPQLGPITLHRAIPGINDEVPAGYVRQIVIGGSILDYRLKLYGDVNIAINGDVLEHGFVTWSVPETYYKLWQLYQDLIHDDKVDPVGLRYLATQRDLVVCTAPAPQFCFKRGNGHEFRSKQIAITQNVSFKDQPPNTVIYNAYPNIKWVRSSRIFENVVTEWDPKDAPEGSQIIRKPLSHNCDCHPRVFRTGRFGSWHNETWIDHAYFDTWRILYSMLHQQEWDSVLNGDPAWPSQ